MSKRLIFLGIVFLILTCLVGVFGIVYFGGDDNRHTAEAQPTHIPLQSVTATIAPIDNNSSADPVTNEPVIMPTMAATEVVATPMNARTATSVAYQTQIPLTSTAVYQAYMGTRDALDLMATSTAAAATVPPSESNP